MKRKTTKMIGTFKAPNKPINSYSSNNKFIDALYRKNKTLIHEKGLTERQFKARMKNIIGEGFSRKEAAYQYSRTRVFLSKEEVGLQNIKENLRRGEALEIRRAQGHYRKGIDWSEYEWDSFYGGYVHKSGHHMISWNYGEDSKSENFVAVTYL